jgi:hypothetical protein
MSYQLSLDIQFNFPLERLRDSTTKTRLAALTKMSRRNLYNYHVIALDYVDDFGEDYPKINGQLCTRADLTKYQCWVLLLIRAFIRKGIETKILTFVLEDSLEIQEFFSKKRFESIYSPNKEEAA